MDNDLFKVARAWWESKRPLAWDEEAHLLRPRVNCETAPESILAAVVAQ